ncbi:PREDICTED: nuclear factor erythroid 2-related factor 3 [Nanorana parkeri]|uniref:nuclear factor erythroid 2-related factor 3 n=1 Tax=Nanorana parkeri TaxID=125878 RepID=UPI0008544E76|nr:PREDICTED: nuclear factor erythroid 2-related factor 3 [Nanorana parkeri]
MKDLKKYMTEGLLQFTILLSLVGVRVDLESYLPPIREIILGSSSAYSQIPFHSLRDTWGGSSLHPKSPYLDSFFTARRLLDEVRALGDPRIPRTELSAWLVHAASGDAEAGAASALLSAGANEESGGSADPPADNEGPSQTPARSSNLQPSHASPSQPHIATEASPGDYTKETQEDKLGFAADSYDYNYLQSENGKRVLDEDITQQNDQDGTTGAARNTDTSANSNLRSEIEGNTTEPSLFFEEFIQLLAQTENALEGTSETSLQNTQPSPRPGSSVNELWQDLLSLPDINITLEDIQSISNSNNPVSSTAPYNVDFTEAISQDVSLQEAMYTSSNNLRSIEDLSQTPESFMQLNSSTVPEGPLSMTDLTSLFPSTDNCSRNSTNQDLLSGLDENVFDEINLMSLALEEGFDPLEVSQLFEEPDSDSGLSLNSSHSPASASISDSSSVTFGEDEGAAGYSSDSESVAYDGLEGAVGGSWADINKFCQMDYQDEASYYDEVTLNNVHHNHTYNQLPDQLQSSPEHHYSWAGKSGKLRSPCVSGMEKSLSRDERRAKSLKIPFTVDEIVSMPVEVFNNMLSKHYLTETQISVIRDIRRRGKNKVAAQNCRKRKLDVILNLEDDVNQLKTRKEKLLKERAQCSKSVSHLKQKLNDLYRSVFSRLRDDQGRPVNPSQYALHCNSDGSIIVVPRRLFKSEQKKDSQKEKKQK